MKYQKPAEGIMLTSEWDDAKAFHVECECTDPDHAVDMWIEVEKEADVELINVSFYVQTTNTFWEEKYNRFRAAWNILTKGFHKQENHMVLNKQAALNFAGAITESVKQLEKRRG